MDSDTPKDSNTAYNLCYNLIVLQRAAVKQLVKEFHQQTEEYVRQMGVAPFVGKADEAAHNTIHLRSRDHTELASFHVSDLIVSLTKYFDKTGKLLNIAYLKDFMTKVREEVTSAEDRIQILYLLDIALCVDREDMENTSLENFVEDSSSDVSIVGHIQMEKGYEIFVDWFADVISYHDTASIQQTDIIFQFLKRNIPKRLKTKKSLIERFRSLTTIFEGIDKKNRALLKELIELYQNKT